MGDLLLARRRSILHAKEARKILKAVRDIYFYSWNPIGHLTGIRGLPIDEYDNYIPDTISEVTEKGFVTASFIEHFEKDGWDLRMTTDAVKDSVAQKINKLRINERTSFKDPYVFNQLGLFALTKRLALASSIVCLLQHSCWTLRFFEHSGTFLSLDDEISPADRGLFWKTFRGMFFGTPMGPVNEVAKELLANSAPPVDNATCTAERLVDDVLNNFPCVMHNNVLLTI